MPAWLDQLLGKPKSPPVASTLALESQLQALRLELGECEARRSALQKELDHARESGAALAGAQIEARLEALFSDTAGPVGQLLTLAYLADTQGKELRAQDVLAVAKRLVRVLQDHGLEFVGAPGETAPYDPARHDPVQSGQSFQPGQPVQVRFAGVAYRGKILRRAGIGE